MRISALLAVALCAVPTATVAQDATPSVKICQLAADGDERVFEVTIRWNGLRRGDNARIDIGARDGSGAIWPQLRDNRLYPRAGTTIERINVGRSQYPLQFILLGFTAKEATAYDARCTNGLCSVRLPHDGISELTGADGGFPVMTPNEAPECSNRS